MIESGRTDLAIGLGIEKAITIGVGKSKNALPLITAPLAEIVRRCRTEISLGVSESRSLDRTQRLITEGAKMGLPFLVPGSEKSPPDDIFKSPKTPILSPRVVTEFDGERVSMHEETFFQTKLTGLWGCIPRRTDHVSETTGATGFRLNYHYLDKKSLDGILGLRTGLDAAPDFFNNQGLPAEDCSRVLNMVSEGQEVLGAIILSEFGTQIRICWRDRNKEIVYQPIAGVFLTEKVSGERGIKITSPKTPSAVFPHRITLPVSEEFKRFLMSEDDLIEAFLGEVQEKLYKFMQT